MRFLYAIKIILLFFAFVFSVSTSAQQTYRDNFSSVSYSNNNGNTNFSAAWNEDNDGDSPSGGNIRITGNRLRFDDLDGNDRIRRTLDLSGASSVTLTLNYDADERGNEGLDIELWNNTTSSWQTIASINNTNTGTVSHNLTSAQISSNSAIRFVSNSNGWGNNERIYIDNVLFTATITAGVSIDDITVNEGAGTATFTVTHTGLNTGGSFTVNYQTTNGSATSGADYTNTTGTLSFNGTVGDTEQINVPILEDLNAEAQETFTISFTGVSNGSVNITDTATGSITDNDSFIITNGVTDATCHGTFLDNGGFGNYSNNQNLVYTLCPDTPTKDILLTLNSFDVEDGYDYLYIYDGTSTAGTLLGQYHNGNLPPATISALDVSGCLTFRFTSDGSVTGSGWDFTLSCVDQTPRIVVDDVTVDEAAGTATFTVNHIKLDASGPFTIGYQTVDGTAIGGNDYTGIVGGTLSFNGTAGDSQQIVVPINDDTLYENTESFTIQFTTTSDPSVDISDGATGTITDNEVILNNTPLVLYEEFAGYIGYTSTGGTLRTQDNNNDACAITTSSSNTLTAQVPATGTVTRAYLYWSHSGATPDSQVTFEGVPVDADLIYTTALSGGRVFYGGVSDVTSILTGIADPNTNVYDFTDLTVDTSNTYCGSATVLGGWSLMVFYSDPGLPASTISLYQGFHGESNSSSTYSLAGFYAIGATGSKTTVLSWEGDQTLNNNEALTVTTGLGTYALTGDGDNALGSANPFNSTIYDNSGIPTVNDATAYGVDLDTYDISAYVTAGESTVTTTVQSGQDFVIMNAVILKVPSNLVTGTVYEDVNYGGGVGRDLIASSGIPLANAVVELYDLGGSLAQTTTTNASGKYVFGGMANGTYTLRVVNSTVKSSRTGGAACGSCMAIQTFKKDYIASTIIPDANSVGGENPSGTDPSAGTLTGAQSIASLTIANEGVAGMDFGFNFNTVVNTNGAGQGSVEQFIVNSNNLGETGLDIEANAIFDPAPGEDTSVFMIPSSSDPLGRSADPNYTGGIFDILIANGSPLTDITGTNTIIDGRSQTAYTGDSNAGTIGSGGTAVGTTGIVLPNYDLPEIQIHKNNGDVLGIQGDNVGIRNLSIYAGNNTGILILGGSSTISNNLLGVNALGLNAGNIDNGIEITAGTVSIDGNYIATNTDAGILIDGGTSSLIQNNHITANGDAACDDNITILDGTGIVINHNLIENAASLGIDYNGAIGNLTITENTIANSGQNGGSCTGMIQNAGIRLLGSNSAITNNNIASNGGAGIVMAGGNTSGNLISQNSIYANGTSGAALGIDIDPTDSMGDGITLNDTGDSDSGPNGSLNFPIITVANLAGTNLVIEGWSRPGATIEIFLTDINEGTAAAGDNQLGMSTDYGEGQTYMATVVEGNGSDTDATTSAYIDMDGNVDTTNKFKFTIPVGPGLGVGTRITSTTTLSNTTSEFSPSSILKVFTVITNRRITFRVKTN